MGIRNNVSPGIVNSDFKAVEKVEADEGFDPPRFFEMRDINFQITDWMAADFNVWKNHSAVFLGLKTGFQGNIFWGLFQKACDLKCFIRKFCCWCSGIKKSPKISNSPIFPGYINWQKNITLFWVKSGYVLHGLLIPRETDSLLYIERHNLY